MRGPLTLLVPNADKLVFAIGVPIDETAVTREQRFPEGNYFALFVQTELEEPWLARKDCEECIDLAVADIAVAASPSLFEHCIFRGWTKVDGADMFVEGAMIVEKPIQFSNEVVGLWRQLHRQQSTDSLVRKRSMLMGHHLARAMNQLLNQDRMLSLWTMLEVWPMEGQSDIRPVSDVLGAHVGMDARDLKERLGLGRLYGYRSQLLHDGELALTSEEMRDLLSKLLDISMECLRQLNGLPYRGGLDRHLA